MINHIKTFVNEAGSIATLSESSFNKLYAIDCAQLFKQKESFGGKMVDYLEWATAWKILKRNYPDATYEIKKYDNAPYLKTEFGVFVEVSVTIEGKTETEIYPVTDGKYEPIAKPDARDIADAHQRALVKAIARHGLGLSAWEKGHNVSTKPNENSYAKVAQPTEIGNEASINAPGEAQQKETTQTLSFKMAKIVEEKATKSNNPNMRVLVLESSGEKVYWNLHMGGWRKLIETLGGDPELDFRLS